MLITLIMKVHLVKYRFTNKNVILAFNVFCMISTGISGKKQILQCLYMSPRNLVGLRGKACVELYY